MKYYKLCLCSLFAFTLVALFSFISYTSNSREREFADLLQIVKDSEQIRPKQNSTQLKCVWFTTFKAAKNRHLIHLNTLVNWAKFIPFMQPVLFSSKINQEYDSIARDLGWHVYQIPRTNEYGTPYISDMVDVIMNGTYDSTFYGFANGDILFDRSLILSLASMAEYKKYVRKGPLLTVGKRTNYKVNANWTNTISDFYYIEQLRTRGKLFGSNAEDYFFFTRDFPRRIFKNLVIGRPAYDNYLVAMAIKLNVIVIDATNTLFVLHQQSPYETDHSGRDENKDAKYNIHMIGKFDFMRGNTDRAPFETFFDSELIKISIRKRVF